MASGRVLSHLGVYALLSPFWELGEDDRRRIAGVWRGALEQSADVVHLYRTVGTRAGCDVMVWSSLSADDPQVPALFLERLDAALRPHRAYIELVDALWGFTGDSQYSRGAAERSIDPFADRSLRYLVVYPFAKTHEWFATEMDERRRMMSEHIRIGRTHEGIDQLLLYSTGLQDHEFVVMYETDDLRAFSKLVADLRSTEARLYTLRDTPVYVGARVTREEASTLWP